MDNARRDKENGIPQKDARVDVAQLADKVWHTLLQFAPSNGTYRLLPSAT